MCDPIRRSAPWMKQLDDRILEHLAEEDWSSSRLMSVVTGFNSASAGRIRERCLVVVHAELIESLVEGSEMHVITGQGRRYQKGEYDVMMWPGVPLTWKAKRALIGFE